VITAEDETATYLVCNKKFKRKSIPCSVPSGDSGSTIRVPVRWIRGTSDDMFTGISDNMFNFLDGQYNLTGMAYWACRPCTAYAQKMNHRMKDIENKLAEAK
jgi:hypothetical protein